MTSENNNSKKFDDIEIMKEEDSRVPQKSENNLLNPNKLKDYNIISKQKSIKNHLNFLIKLF